MKRLLIDQPMGLTETLREEHQRLHEHLALVETALHKPTNAHADLQELCGLLIQRFEVYIDREDQVLAPLNDLIRGLLQSRSAGDHADQRVVLRDLQALWTGTIKAPGGSAATHVTYLIGELRECLEWEEREVFPIVDRLADERSQALAGSSAVSDDH